MEKASVQTKKEATRNRELWEAARDLIPGGVSSPVRAFREVGGTPFFVEKGFGSKLYDVDGKSYLDFVMSWGPLILGHANPEVLNTLKQILLKGTSFGAPTAAEVELAQHIRDLMPSLEQIRFVNSGTEAAMSALRVARAATNRDLIVKFEGCYHGHLDALLVKAGSGVSTLGLKTSAGIPQGFLATTRVLPYNDLASAKTLFKEEGSKIAAVIVEPIAGNMGLVPAKKEFLEGLRALTQRHGALLIFDEVISGFRVGLGGAQELYRVAPDLTLLGKVIGGGFPIGAFGGKREFMRLLAPEGPVYQAGTLSGNPISVGCGIVTLKILSRRGTYETLEKKGALLEAGFKRALSQRKVGATFVRVGSMFTLFFGEKTPSNYQEVQKTDKKRYARFFQESLKRGVYFAPSPFETNFLSLAHSEEELEGLSSALEELFACLS